MVAWLRSPSMVAGSGGSKRCVGMGTQVLQIRSELDIRERRRRRQECDCRCRCMCCDVCVFDACAAMHLQRAQSQMMLHSAPPLAMLLPDPAVRTQNALMRRRLGCCCNSHMHTAMYSMRVQLRCMVWCVGPPDAWRPQMHGAWRSGLCAVVLNVI